MCDFVRSVDESICPDFSVLDSSHSSIGQQSYQDSWRTSGCVLFHEPLVEDEEDYWSLEYQKLKFSMVYAQGFSTIENGRPANVLLNDLVGGKFLPVSHFVSSPQSGHENVSHKVRRAHNDPVIGRCFGRNKDTDPLTSCRTNELSRAIIGGINHVLWKEKPRAADG